MNRRGFLAALTGAVVAMAAAPLSAAPRVQTWWLGPRLLPPLPSPPVSFSDLVNETYRRHRSEIIQTVSMRNPLFAKLAYKGVPIAFDEPPHPIIRQVAFHE